MAKNSAKEQGAMSAASVFKAIDNVLKKPGCGCSGSLDYMEQSSWLLFLRYLDAREEERKLEARLNGKVYEPALPRRLRWSEWAYPLDAAGKLDYEKFCAEGRMLFLSLWPAMTRQPTKKELYDRCHEMGDVVAAGLAKGSTHKPEDINRHLAQTRAD